MSEATPILTIRRAFARPSHELLAAFAGVPTAHVADAMDGRGALDYRIKPLDPARATFVGGALTCQCAPGDNLAIGAALAELDRGDVIVAATDGHATLAVVGRRMSGMARNRGAVAIVTDGLVRDAAGVRESGVPVFCAGVTPNAAAAVGPGTVGLPVVVGGVAVASGDIVVADADGAVVVPAARATDVIERLRGVRARETDLAQKLAAGLGVPRQVTELLASAHVRYLD